MKSISEELFGIDLFGTSTTEYYYKNYVEVAAALIDMHNLKVKIAERSRQKKKEEIMI